MPLAMWLVISASGGTRHPRGKLGKQQGSICFGYGAGAVRKIRQGRKQAFVPPDSRAGKQARSAVSLSEPRMRGTPSATVPEDVNGALEERTVCEF